MTMTYILNEHFGCAKPFRKTPEKVYDPETKEVTEKYTTTAGDTAYSKLVSLLYDVGAVTGTDMNGIIENMDDLMLSGEGAYERGE